MSDLRKAAQQALKAMGCAVPTGKITLYEWDRAISDLSAALAQQPEPVCKCDLRTRLVGDGCEVCNPRLAAEFAQQAEQEPVAWFQERSQTLLPTHPECWGRENEEWTPLYTAPPQRPPLTDEEIEDIFKHLCSTVGASYKTMARAIERKVRGEEK